MAGAIVQQPPKERDRTVGSRFALLLKKFAFFDEKQGKMYNYIVRVRNIIDFADFSLAVLPYMVTKSSKRRNTFFHNGFTHCEMGIIASRG